MIKILKLLLHQLVNYILPLRCLSCYELVVGDKGFCAQCWNKLNFITKPYCKLCGYQFNLTILEGSICGKCIKQKPYFDNARSLLKFDQHSKEVIHAFKYYDRTELAEVFAKLIYNKYNSEFADIDIIIPTPMYKLKRLLRMYNQAHILAKELAILVKKPLYPNLVIKTKWTKPQASLSKAERERNLSGSFKINARTLAKFSIENKTILLVDDVMTTGTTVQSCSKLLKAMGAKSVFVVTIAMT